MFEKKVVIVDDDEDLLKLLSAAFTSRGFPVHTITTGKGTLEYFSNESNVGSTALLLLDRMLPDADGLDILQKLSKSFKDQIPVLILSVLAEDQDIVQGLKMGAIDYIVKPFNISLVLEKADVLIDHHKM